MATYIHHKTSLKFLNSSPKKFSTPTPPPPRQKFLPPRTFLNPPPPKKFLNPPQNCLNPPPENFSTLHPQNISQSHPPPPKIFQSPQNMLTSNPLPTSLLFFFLPLFFHFSKINLKISWGEGLTADPPPLITPLITG